MKFGKQLQSTMVAQWAEYYVDYKSIKQEIKEIGASGVSPPARVERFVELLAEQLETVNMFFKTEQASVMAKWKTIDINSIQATDEDKASMVQWLIQRQQGDSAKGAQPRKIGRKQMHQLNLFCSVYDAAQKLSQYVAINYVAFVKGMKKFEKRTELSVGHIFMPRLQRAVFFNSPSLAILLAEVDFSAKDLLLRLGCGSGEDNILDEFRCCLCHEMMRQPIVLSCSHRFCWQCTAQASAVASTEGEWCCPSCRYVDTPQTASEPTLRACAAFVAPAVLDLSLSAVFSSRPQGLNPEIYCVATSLSTLVERHIPSNAKTRDGDLEERRKASLEAEKQPNGGDDFAADATSIQVQNHQKLHHGAEAAPHHVDFKTEARVAAPELPPSITKDGLQSAATGAMTVAQQTSVSEEPTMALAVAVDPSNSVITCTKEQSYYDDLVTLADVELPSWPFEVHDADLEDMLPQVEPPTVDPSVFDPNDGASHLSSMTPMSGLYPMYPTAATTAVTRVPAVQPKGPRPKRSMSSNGSSSGGPSFLLLPAAVTDAECDTRPHP